MTLAYYPGCSGLSTSRDYEKSTRAVCEILGVHFRDVPDWSCCGASPARITDFSLSAALCARNLVQAKEAGHSGVFTPCPSCLSNFKHARRNLEDVEFRKKVEKLIECSVEDLPDTRGILQVLLENAGLEAIQRRVVKPLTNISVVPYYGCIITRPPEIMCFDHPENPTSMDSILKTLGAAVLPFPLKVECCGASSGVPRREITARLSGRILSAATAAGADAVVVACPLCQMNLDLRQEQAAKAAGEKFDIPVFYITQLMGLAFGLKPKALGINKLSASPKKALQKFNRPIEKNAEQTAAGGRA
jgi:heterodisulfide reductase subunit B